MTTKIKNVIAVDGDHVQGAGATTWWRLTGVNGDRIREALTAAGLGEDLLPNPIEDLTALQRAILNQVAHGGEYNVIPFGKRSSTSGYAVERDIVDGTDVKHETILKVILKEDSSLHIWEAHPAIAEKLTEAYEQERWKLDGVDIGMWLSNKVLPYLGALSLRPKGGIYYVPPTTLGTWRRVTQVVSECGAGEVFEMPAMECEQAVHAILSAVTMEAAAAARKVEEEILSNTYTKVGLQNRISTLDRVLAKVNSYEEMLGAALPELHDRIEKLSAQIAAAILTVTTTNEEAA